MQRSQPALCAQPAHTREQGGTPDVHCSEASAAAVPDATATQAQQTVGQIASLVSRFRTAPPRARKQRYQHVCDAPSNAGEQPLEPVLDLQAVHRARFGSPALQPASQNDSLEDTEEVAVCKSVAWCDSAEVTASSLSCSTQPSEDNGHALDVTASIQSVSSAHSIAQSAVVQTVSQLRTAPPRRTVCLNDQRQVPKQGTLCKVENPAPATETAVQHSCAASRSADQHVLPLCIALHKAEVSAESKQVIDGCEEGAEAANQATRSDIASSQRAMAAFDPIVSLARSPVGGVNAQGAGEDDSVSDLLKRCRNILSSRKSAADSVVSSSHGSAKTLTSSSMCAAASYILLPWVLL